MSATPKPLIGASHGDRRPIGQTLLGNGLISEDQLRIALLDQDRRPRQLGRVLVDLGFITEATLRDALSARLGRQSIDLAAAAVDPAGLALVPEELAHRHCLLPLHFDADTHTLIIACADAHDILAFDALRSHCGEGLDIVLRLAAESDLRRAIDRHYGYRLSIDGILHEIESGVSAVAPSAVTPETGDLPVVRLIDALLVDAVKHDASDIHFEPEAGFLRIRYRIDGLLRQIRVIHLSYWPAMVVRIKIMSGLNIAETRSPQDGRISLTIRGQAVDFRVSAQPTLHGENLVLRVLERHKGIVALDRLGFTPCALERLRRIVARPEGLVLVTGPTGSGKTTTLYSILNQLNDETLNIMTLEDPVEYPLSMIRQTAVSDAARIDFAGGIRAMLRQDPDVILVGEIRDAETAEMAFRAAMTGHRVFSTLHTNSALGAIPRLIDIGIRRDILAGNLVGVVAQRLVRQLCPQCKQPEPATPAERALLGLEQGVAGEIHRARGCPACGYRGYRGRLALTEILQLDDELDELLASGASRRTLLEAARERGFTTLAEDGVRRVRDGSTSIEELCRVIALAPGSQ